MNQNIAPQNTPPASESFRARLVAKLDKRLRRSTLMPRLRLAFWALQDLKSGRRPRLPQRTGKYRVEKQRPFGVNVSGYLSGEFGIGEAARGFVHALHDAQIPHVLFDYRQSAHRADDATFSNFSDESPYLFNLVAVNADTALAYFRYRGPQHFIGHYNIGLWFWELETFPVAWRPLFDFYHEIWTTSEFCARALRAASPISVVKIPHPLLLDVGQVRGQRAAFGLPENVFAFVFSFDYLSIVQRKNPVGTIEAFRRAFGERRDALLVIKTINAHLQPTEAAALREYSRGLNVVFLDRHLSRGEMLNLFNVCDCLVSLHRSEGLGLGMAEAMRLGKPVIATAYSGNMEFMTPENSFLVPYQLVPLREDFGAYGRGNFWAEPDIDAAATQMRCVFENREAAAQRALIGQRDVSEKMNPRVAGAAIKARLEELASTRNSS